MELEVRHLRALCAIADTGSLHRAARELGVAQPSLSTQLRRIEQELGGELFTRTGPAPSYPARPGRPEPRPTSGGRDARPGHRGADRRRGRTAAAHRLDRQPGPVGLAPPTAPEPPGTHAPHGRLGERTAAHGRRRQTRRGVRARGRGLSSPRPRRPAPARPGRPGTPVRVPARRPSGHRETGDPPLRAGRRPLDGGRDGRRRVRRRTAHAAHRRPQPPVSCTAITTPRRH